MEFYHGTSDIFDIQELRPAIETGNLREEWRKKLTNKVFSRIRFFLLKYLPRKRHKSMVEILWFTRLDPLVMSGMLTQMSM